MVLLDCAHMYHAQCLESFEKFDQKPILERYHDEENNAAGAKGKTYGHACPMCRHPKYKKVNIKV